MAKVTNKSVIGINEPMQDKTILSSELEDDGYDLRRLVQLMAGGGVACFIKNSTDIVTKKNPQYFC